MLVSDFMCCFYKKSSHIVSSISDY